LFLVIILCADIFQNRCKFYIPVQMNKLFCFKMEKLLCFHTLWCGVERLGILVTLAL
jgi:hypothetical protein